MKLGRTAVIQDPTGGLVSLWQAGLRKGLDYAGGPGVASWRELLTDDVRTATAFYCTVFGWTGEVAESNGWVFAGLNNREQPVAVIVTPPPALAGAKPFWAVYFGVHDVNATAAKVQELGGRALIEPTEYAGVPYALLRDPLGAVFFISGMPAA